MHRSVSYSAIIREVPPAADRNRCRDSQPDITQKVQVLGTHSSKWEVSIKFFLSRLRESHRKCEKKVVRARKDGGYQENRALLLNQLARHI